jgi:hypothetical protein
VYGEDLDAESGEASDRDTIVAKENDTLAKLVPNAELGRLYLRINRRTFTDLTLHARLQAGTTLRGPTQTEIDDGIVSVDEDEPRALKERYVIYRCAILAWRIDAPANRRRRFISAACRYYALDNETPRVIAQKLEVSVAELCQVNVALYAGFKKNAKLEAGTSVLVPLVAKRSPADLGPEEIGQSPREDTVNADEGSQPRRERVKRQNSEQGGRSETSGRGGGGNRSKLKRGNSGGVGKATSVPTRLSAPAAGRLKLTKPIQAAREWTNMAKMSHFQIMGAPQSEWFRQPVDEKKYKDYREHIHHPMDLGTIRLKLELLQYVPMHSPSHSPSLHLSCDTFAGPLHEWVGGLTMPSSNRQRGRYEELEDYFADMELVVANAEKYNDDDGVLGVVAELRDLFKAAASKLRLGPPTVFPYHNKDVIDSRFNEKLSTVHVSLMSLEDAAAFNEPVDLAQFPDYTKEIALPADLGTINVHLQEQGYRKLSRYVAEVFRVFSNARAYNKFGSGVYVAADMLEAWFRVAVWQLTGDSTMLHYVSDGTNAITITRALREQLVKTHEKVNRTAAPAGVHHLTHTTVWLIIATYPQVCLKPRDSKPFQVAVEDLKVDDDYYADISRPIDLGTIGERLARGVYKKVGECVPLSRANVTPLNNVHLLLRLNQKVVRTNHLPLTHTQPHADTCGTSTWCGRTPASTTSLRVTFTRRRWSWQYASTPNLPNSIS